MSLLDEIIADMDAADRKLRDAKLVDPAKIDISRWYRQEGYRDGPTPFPDKIVAKLAIKDMTSDGRFQDYFMESKSHLGLYRTNLGGYWLLRYDPGLGDHWIDQIGSAEAAMKRFGPKE